MSAGADRRIRVLVVDDSAAMRELLVHILRSDPEIEVAGTAGNGEEAIGAVRDLRPDLVTMDIAMPRMNGMDATRRIMESCPTPIVLVTSSWDARAVETTFRALEAGALAVLATPNGPADPRHDEDAAELVLTVKLMSEVKVVRRWARARPAKGAAAPPAVEAKRMPGAKIRVVAIGASTGGPVAIHTVLSGLPGGFPVPVAIVQHMAHGFTRGLVDWLGRSTPLEVRLAEHGERLLPGRVYVAPDGRQMAIGDGETVSLSWTPASDGLRPSVSHFFRSVARVYGKHAAAVLLTGMGKDGAEEMKILKELGAVTIAQDHGSSVVHGMPGEAIRIRAATRVLPPEKIASALVALAEDGDTVD